ncbi:polysaccharide deacetylase family protein [Amycolatopsis acidiphila]|uniref:Polysaccharide deacetylase family protein n=1 Tax=Amycolatopsis acidiphila TaxID=715473 RepID=A0A558AJ94_9PSEU|nr:polysaccharide deacetylase family protein [Amycolatopsis acidiphila]TVT24333.1 polysaccharide deacetylase family protein [Amycolatopsis acidiphila]UIJ62532.1 polysaccharide deacetylase family protein [Amycolatopsis acidiphila]GHG85245.1 polysaccharide deacetylase familiy protein [Amycolatopsis acidiphila]
MKTASLVLAAGVAHAGPAAAFLPPLRNRFLPRLAGVGDPGHVALTFDDGPNPLSTPHFLRLLEARRTRATFFVLGSQVARAPGVARDIVDAGHELAVHGWEHRCLLRYGPRRVHDDLARACEVIEQASGRRPHWFRAPYGVFSGGALLAARRLRLKPVLWTCWGFDWTERATGSSVLRTVLKDLDGGGTVLLHDSDHAASVGAWRATLAALGPLLDECAHRGLRVGPLADHAIDR